MKIPKLPPDCHAAMRSGTRTLKLSTIENGGMIVGGTIWPAAVAMCEHLVVVLAAESMMMKQKQLQEEHFQQHEKYSNTKNRPFPYSCHSAAAAVGGAAVGGAAVGGVTKNVLELGSGTGAVGIYAAALLGVPVTLTEHKPPIRAVLSSVPYSVDGMLEEEEDYDANGNDIDIDTLGTTTKDLYGGKGNNDNDNDNDNDNTLLTTTRGKNKKTSSRLLDLLQSNVEANRHFFSDHPHHYQKDIGMERKDKTTATATISNITSKTATNEFIRTDNYNNTQHNHTSQLQQHQEQHDHDELLLLAPLPCVEELDWGNLQHIERILQKQKQVQNHNHNQHERMIEPSREIGDAGFDMILASDVTYYSDLHDRLAMTISKLLAKHKKYKKSNNKISNENVKEYASNTITTTTCHDDHGKNQHATISHKEMHKVYNTSNNNNNDMNDNINHDLMAVPTCWIAHEKRYLNWNGVDVQLSNFQRALDDVGLKIVSMTHYPIILDKYSLNDNNNDSDSNNDNNSGNTSMFNKFLTWGQQQLRRRKEHHVYILEIQHVE